MPTVPAQKIDVALAGTKGTSLKTGKLANLTLARSGYQKPTSSALAIGANAGMNFQQKLLFVEGISKVRFAFGDTRNASPDNETTPALVASGDMPPPVGAAILTYHCRVYYGSAVDSDTALFLPGATSGTGWASTELTFGPNAKTTEICPPGMFILSEWVDLPPGTTKVILKTWVTWTGNAYGLSYGIGNYNSPGTVFFTEASAFDTVDKTITALTFGMYNDGSGGRGKGCAWAEGMTTAPTRTKPIVLVNGDSRYAQAIIMNPTGGGMLVYNGDPVSLGIARNGYSHTNITIAQSSERQLDLVASRWYMRGQIAQKADYVVIGLGYNDLAAGTAVMFATLRSLKARINAQGAKMIVCTIYPNTTNSNTVKGVYDATRIAYNDYLRSAAAIGDVSDGPPLDIADAVEGASSNTPIRTRNGGFFITPDGITVYDTYLAPAGSIYNDGIHMNAVGVDIAGYYVATKVNNVMPLPIP